MKDALREALENVERYVAVAREEKERAQRAEARIETLEARVATLSKALEPFAKEAGGWTDMWEDSFVPSVDTSHCCENCGHSNKEETRAKFTVGDLRRAAREASR